MECCVILQDTIMLSTEFQALQNWKDAFTEQLQWALTLG